MISRFEFNKVIILDSLDPSEKQTGKDLYNDTIKRKCYQIEELLSDYHYIRNRSDFINSIEQIRQDILENENWPLMHCEIHGSKDGFILNSDELVPWREVANSFRELNILTKNNLFITLATCYGAYIYGQLIPSQPSPFWAFVGPWEKVYNEDILASYTEFFDSFLALTDRMNYDIQKAMEKLNSSNPKLPYRYYFYNAETVFEQVFTDYADKLKNPEVFKKKINEMWAKSLGDPTIRRNETIWEIRARLIDYYQNQIESQKTKMKNIFLMRKN